MSAHVVPSTKGTWLRRAGILAVVVVVLIGAAFAYGSTLRADTGAAPGLANNGRAADRAFAVQYAQADVAPAVSALLSGRAADRSFARQYSGMATGRAADRAFTVQYAQAGAQTRADDRSFAIQYVAQ